MKKIRKFFASILTVSISLLNVSALVPVTYAEETADISVSGIWDEASSETEAIMTFSYSDCKASQNPLGIAVFYDDDKALEAVYIYDTQITDNKAECGGNIDFSTISASSVKLMLIDGDTLKPLSDYLELTYDEFKDKIYHEVSEITDSGNYTIRTAFETDTIERFKYDTYTTQIAEYYITDEVKAHTGQYSCKVSNRIVGDETVTIELDGLDLQSKLSVSCYVRSAQGIAEQPFYIKVRLVQESGISYVSLPGSETVSYGDWAEMSGELDLSQYSLTEEPWLFIMTKNSSSASGGTTLSEYYIDDILITADTEGMFYDDMNYTPAEKTEEISQTASEYTPHDIPVQQDIASLKEVYKDYFKVGLAVADRSMSAASRYGQLISKHFNTMTSEGRLKISYILNSDMEYDFTYADETMDFVKAAGLDELVGHVLIWENSTSKTYTDNFSTRDELLAFMKEYITKVITHFEGDGDADEYADGVDYSNWHIGAWDVVNECAASEFADGYINRGGGYMNIIGSDYPIYAFKYADALGYDDIQLRYNDFGEHNTRKGTNIYNAAKDLTDADAGLDVVAFQSHYALDDSVDNIRSAIEKVASLGVEIDISELDISAYTRGEMNAGTALYEDGVPKTVEYKQTEKLYHLFEIYKEYSDIINRVTLWSATDRLSFRNNESFAHKDYPGIFDRNFQAKPQYWVITDFEEFKNRYPDYCDELENLNWNFEDEYNYGISRDPDIGKWTGVNLNYVQDSTEPSVMKVTDVENYNHYYADQGSTSSAATPWGTVTDPAYGSTQCMTVYNGTSTSAQALGARVKLSNTQLVPGKTYTISFWHMGNTKDGNLLYAFLRPFSNSDNIEEKYSDSVDGISWVTEQTQIGRGTRHWQRITAEITVKESDFDSDGYTNLWLLARAPYNATTGKYYKTYKDEKLYLDDIAIYPKVSSSWNFEGTASTYVSKKPAVGKWTGINQDYVQNSTVPNTMSVDNATTYNLYYASLGSTAGYAQPTGKVLSPADGSTRCMMVYNGTSTSAQAMGARVKLSKADLIPGETYTLSFWQLSNSVSYNNIYAFLRKYDMTENISEKIQSEYDAVPWLSEYDSLGNSTRYWMQQTVQLSPTDEDFDENGYTTLWILSRSLVQNGTFHKCLKGEYFYIDDVSITKN